ncbi:MAG TPA: choice-of-anchor C family protein [Casimicrobiaceae bacterium]|jgi:choice-of-anchor C domain-containing protein
MDRMAKALWSAAWLACATCASAAPFQNGSFEVGGPACFTFNIPAGTTFTPGWVVSIGNIDWDGPPPCSVVASNGTHSLDLVGTGGIGGVRQTFDTVPGTTYQVSFDLAGNPGAPPAIKPLTVTVAGTTHDYTFDITGHDATNMGWTTQTFTFVATASSETIDFVSDVTAAGGTLNAGATLDNVRVAPLGAGTASLVPVPLSWAQWAAALLLALGGAWVIGRRRRAG